ncbi:hypothetical protein [Streptomyces prasinus]|uniref:hypothetical protein n=1 Tax=Streptomyces prasinus TaxID=67345 RepID=UPI0036C76EA2
MARTPDGILREVLTARAQSTDAVPPLPFWWLRNGAPGLRARPDPDDLPNKFGPVQRFRRAAAYPRIALLIQLVMALALRPELDRKVEQITGGTFAAFERYFRLDYKPRTTTGPWIRGKFNSLVEATAKYAATSG